ncbi:MAG: hypothetical protein IT275_06125 [Chitinophagales bacterium]|nr:hypothetical protein [Chitinophagales bacterium]
MQKNLSFHQTIAGSLQSSIDPSIWDKVLAAYDKGDYGDAIRNCINYINPSIEQKYANADKTTYVIPHGSILVELQITKDSFVVNAPFLYVEGAKIVPLLRQVAQLNFTPLSISSIVLENEKLYFKYSCPLNVAEPYKVYDVLREICINADNYDDEFINKFNAKRIQEPRVTPYTAEQKEQAWQKIQQYIVEAFDAYDQLESKRLTSYLWDVLMISILKIDYYCAPQGTLRSEIEKTLSFLNSKEDYYQRLSKGKEFLKKLQQYERAKFDDDLYKIEVFVPYKFRTNLDGVRNILKYAYETSEKEIKSLDFIGASCTLEYGILNLFYNHNIEDAIANELSNAMENAAGKPMQETATLLFDAVKKVMTSDAFLQSVAALPKTDVINPSPKKGFFNKLFG